MKLNVFLNWSNDCLCKIATRINAVAVESQFICHNGPVFYKTVNTKGLGARLPNNQVKSGWYSSGSGQHEDGGDTPIWLLARKLLVCLQGVSHFVHRPS